MSLSLFPTRTAPATDLKDNDLASRSVHGTPEPGLLYLLPARLPGALTSASSRSSVEEKANAIVPQRRRECTPHLEPYRYLLGGGDYPHPTVLEAYSK